MNEQLKQFGMGAKFLPADLLTEEDLGPLKALVGEWKSVTSTTSDPQGAAQNTASGWNVISVPGEGGFVFEVIPYVEHLKFSKVAVQATNRGPVFGKEQMDQQIFGLFYEQEIISDCDTPFCVRRQLDKGKTIHAETGLFLYIKDFNGGYTIARLSLIPHGNALLALGTADVTNTPGTNFFDDISSVSTNLDDTPIKTLGYNDQIIGERQFPVFAQATPNAFLKSTLDSIVGKGILESMTTLKMSTDTPNAAGGILNIPFIQNNVTATSMDATFWLQNIVGGSEPELLQYSQTINLVFPLPGTVTPIKWPHITINTLKRVVPQENSLMDSSETRPHAPQL